MSSSIGGRSPAEARHLGQFPSWTIGKARACASSCGCGSTAVRTLSRTRPAGRRADRDVARNRPADAPTRNRRRLRRLITAHVSRLRQGHAGRDHPQPDRSLARPDRGSDVDPRQSCARRAECVHVLARTRRQDRRAILAGAFAGAPRTSAISSWARPKSRPPTGARGDTQYRPAALTLRLALMVGCRIGEAIGITADQIDAERSVWTKPASQPNSESCTSCR